MKYLIFLFLLATSIHSASACEGRCAPTDLYQVVNYRGQKLVLFKEETVTEIVSTVNSELSKEEKVKTVSEILLAMGRPSGHGKSYCEAAAVNYADTHHKEEEILRNCPQVFSDDHLAKDIVELAPTYKTPLLLNLNLAKFAKLYMLFN